MDLEEIFFFFKRGFGVGRWFVLFCYVLYKI